MSKLIGKKYPLDVVIDLEKVKEITPKANGKGLHITFKDWTFVEVDKLTSVNSQ